MKRPLGIVLSAIALGSIALLSLLFALGAMATSLNGPRFLESAPVPNMPSASALNAILLVMTLVFLALSAISTITAVGLLRMRSWARLSALLIASCVSGLGLFFAVGAMTLNSGASLTAVSLMVAVLAAGWFLYLARRSTREVFEQTLKSQPHPPEYFPGEQIGRFQSQNLGASSQPHASPLTDFSVARPIQSQNASGTAVLGGSEDLPAEQPPYAAPYWQPQLTPQTPIPKVRRSVRPVSVTILAFLALISAFFNIFGVIAPGPGFLFGYVVGGWPLHLYSVVSSAALAICGLGMLRLQRPAWLLSFVLLAINSANFFAFLLPGPRARYATFLAAQQQALLDSRQPALPPNIMAASIAFGMVAGLAVMLFFAFLLWRARWAFEPAQVPETASEPHAE